MKKVLVFAFLSLLLFSSNPIFSQSVRNPVTGKKVLAVKKITTSLGTSYILIHDKKKKEEVFYVQSNDKKEEVRFMVKITNEIFNKTEYYSIKSGNQEILQLSETRYFSFTSGININAEIMVPYPSKDGFNFLGYIDKSGSGLYWQEYIAIIDVQSKKLITPFLNNTYFELFNADRPECKMNYHEIGRDGINWLKKCGKNWQLFDNEGCSLSWSYPNGNINVGPVYKKDGSATYSLVEQQKRKAKEQNDYKNNSSPQCSWLHEIPGETTKETMFGTQTTTHLITYTWSGGCENGLLSGKGKLIWYDNGIRKGMYEGEMKNGKKFGQSVTTFYDPTGEFKGIYQNGLENGYGESTEGGYNFKGEYNNGKKWNGYGTVMARTGLLGFEMRSAKWIDGERIVDEGNSNSSSSSSSGSSSGTCKIKKLSSKTENNFGNEVDVNKYKITKPNGDYLVFTGHGKKKSSGGYSDWFHVATSDSKGSPCEGSYGNKFIYNEQDFLNQVAKSLCECNSWTWEY